MKHAQVDENGIYIGLVEIADGETIPDNCVTECPDGCDLKPGSAKWDYERRTFIPVVRNRHGEILPDATRALVECVCAVAKGKPLPDGAKRFLEWYSKTNDGKGIDFP